MKRMILTGVVLLSVLMVWAPQILAATTQPAPAIKDAPTGVGEMNMPHWHDIEGMDAFHRPFDGLTMGLDFRFRDEYNHNTTSLSDQFGDGVSRNPTTRVVGGNWNEENAQRYRMRWSTIWTLAPDVTFNTRLVWEFWTFNTERASSITSSDQNLDLREMIFDRMNLTFKNAFDAPMTLVIGRQDISLGTGWLVNEGTPRDGSRTMYFDAVRATIDLAEKTQLDLIGISQSDDEDTWLPPFNHRDWLSATQKTDETGFIAYLTDKSFENTTLEGYYIYKKDEPSDYSKFWRNRGEFWSSTSLAPDDEIHTFGGRIAQNLDKNWSYSVEVAKQFGTKNEESMNGLGTNNKLAYAFNDEWKNELRLTQEYLSGDDPDTRANEAFDPLWGEWPQPQRGGDLLPTLYAYETAKGEVTNLHRVGVGHTFKPAKEWTLMTDYNLLWADENTKAGTGGTNNGIKFNNDGNFRGQLFSWVAKYSCCKNFNTFLQLDYFVPGSYYDQSSRDHATFARINFEWTF
jgi:hypothetical protein